MSDILIKGMEMPKAAGRMEAVIMILKDGTAQIAISPTDDQIGYWKEYSLIPVPAHGDLIDRAELWVEIKKICDRRDAGIITDLACLQQILSAVRHAHTVIPAEED